MRTLYYKKIIDELCSELDSFRKKQRKEYLSNRLLSKEQYKTIEEIVKMEQAEFSVEDADILKQQTDEILEIIKEHLTEEDDN